MGVVSSSQSGSSSLFVYLYSRSRPSKPTPSDSPDPLNTPAPTSEPTTSPSHATPHRHSRSAAFESGTTTSAKLKERQAWYRHLKHNIPVSQRKAKKTALVVRSLIVGPPEAASPKVTKAAGRPQLIKIKSHLVDPKSANRVIAELRTLPASDNEVLAKSSVASSDQKRVTAPTGPIHAVCLEHTGAEVDRIISSSLARGDNSMDLNLTSFADIGSATIDALLELFNEIHVVDLIKSPDLGLGRAGDEPGALAGAVPTPETVIKGIEEITPQLMALGFAVGKSMIPDHKGIYPPTDRMSVLTYWWGLELLLPPPSLAYLANAQSISGAVINFLTALSLVNNGVREILPLVRYISQFIDFEFSQIKRRDHGKGVVCAATWLMPAALVPRPWDFPDPPVPSINPPKDEDDLDGSPDIKPHPTPVPKPSPTNGMPFLTPVPVTPILDTITVANPPDADPAKPVS